MSARVDSGNSDERARRHVLVLAAAADFAFLLACSAALSVTLLFAVAHLTANIGAVCLLSAPVLVILFAGSWPRRVVLGGMALSLTLLAVGTAAAALLAPGGIVLYTGDTGLPTLAGSLLFAGVTLASPIACHLIARRGGGWLALLALGVVLGVAAQLLRGDWVTGADASRGAAIMAVCVMGACGMQAARRYARGVRDGSQVAPGMGSLLLTALSSVALACLATLAGVALFAGIVEPLHVSAVRVHPILGATAPDPSKHGDVPIPAGGGASSSGFLGSLDWNVLLVVLLALVVLTIVAVIVTALVITWRRRAGFAAIRRLPEASRAGALYGYSLRELRASGVLDEASQGLTPRELVKSGADLPEGFNQLVNVHERVCYAGLSVSEDELAAAEAIVRSIPRFAREKLGWRAWLRAIRTIPQP